MFAYPDIKETPEEDYFIYLSKIYIVFKQNAS